MEQRRCSVLGLALAMLQLLQRATVATSRVQRACRALGVFVPGSYSKVHEIATAAGTIGVGILP